jgi:hypothetical protein
MITDFKVIGFEGIDWFILSRVLFKEFNENSGWIKPLDFLINWSCRFLQDSVAFSNVIYISSVSCVRLTKRLKPFYLNHETILSYIWTHALVCVGSVMAQMVSRRNVAEEAPFIPQIFSCGNCGEGNDTGIGCTPSASVFTCEYLSTNPPHWFVYALLTLYNLSNWQRWSGVAQSVQRIATPGRSGDRVTVGARISAFVQTLIHWVLSHNLG